MSVMKHLPEVTLRAIDIRLPMVALAALQRSMASTGCARVLLLGHGNLGDQAEDGIARIDVGPIESLEAYSDFMLRHLLSWIDTSHGLMAQWDGFVADAAHWDPAFLEVDYLSARWGKAPEGQRVGNGGFSLRSRRLLQALQDPHFAGRLHHPEDICISQTLRTELERRHGIVFGSLEMARRFAGENEVVSHDCFGFHGVANLPRLMAAPAFGAMIGQLPAAVIAGRGGFKAARALRRQGEPGLALKLLDRRAAAGRLDARCRPLRWPCRFDALSSVHEFRTFFRHPPAPTR